MTRNFQYNFICDDCICVFTIYLAKIIKKPVCPLCKSDRYVRDHVSERMDKGSNKFKKRWSDGELIILRRHLKGELTAYQVSYLVGRSVNSVIKKSERMRRNGI